MWNLKLLGESGPQVKKLETDATVHNLKKLSLEIGLDHYLLSENQRIS